MPNKLLAPVDIDPFGGQTGAFGTASPGELGAGQPNILDKLFGGLINNLVTLPKRAIEASNNRLVGGDYDPGPILEAAMLPMGTGALAGVPMRAGEAVLGAGPIRAYHGSPHDFDKFSLSKIGTGEGNQSFGHGLYFAENEAVAKGYRDALAGKSMRMTDGSPVTPQGAVDVLVDTVQGAHPQFGQPTQVAQWIFNRRHAGKSTDDIERDIRAMAWDEPQKDAARTALKATEGWKTDPKMYEVQIKADPEHFLDYDKALPVEHAAREKLKEIAKLGLEAHAGGADRQLAKDAFVQASNPNLTGDGLYRQMTNAIEAARPKLKEMGNPRALFGGTAPMANEELLKVGIPGIKYLDQGSRMAGEGSRNFVVFDDNLVDIIKKYGMAGMSMLPPATAAFLSSKIKPVDHDPFGPSMVPVDHDPFAEKL